MKWSLIDTIEIRSLSLQIIRFGLKKLIHSTFYSVACHLDAIRRVSRASDLLNKLHYSGPLLHSLQRIVTIEVVDLGSCSSEYKFIY